MSAAKFTPGPWEWDGNPCDYDASNEAPWLVTHAYAAGTETSMRDGVILRGQIICQYEANARLIAAAPDLLEALQVCASQSIGTDWTAEQALQFIKEHARAAIAKATGEGA